MTATEDQTARILAQYGTPEKRRDYAVMEAGRIYREARQAARDAYVAAGGTYPIPFRIGNPVYDALVRAVTDASNEYGHAVGDAMASYRAETELFS